MKVERSLRYGVVGVYKDRSSGQWRIYPVPFVRITVGEYHTSDCEREYGPDGCVGHL